MKQSLILLLTKFVLSLLLLKYALPSVDLGTLINEIIVIPSYFVIFIILTFFIAHFIAALRIKVLMEILNIKLNIFKVIEITMVGAFFSQTMVSFLSGDAMRIRCLTLSNIPLGLASKCTFLDRLCGFASLIALIFACLPITLNLIPDLSMKIALVATCVAGIGAIAVLFLIVFLPNVFFRWKLSRWAIEFSEAAYSIVLEPKGFSKAMLLSVFIQSIVVLALYVTAVSLSINVSYFSLFLLCPSVILVSMMPISVAGWGVRESAMVVALGLCEIAPQQSINLSICFGLASLAASLPGGIFFLLQQGSKRAEQVSI